MLRATLSENYVNIMAAKERKGNQNANGIRVLFMIFHDCPFYKVLLNVLACLIRPALDSSNDPKCVDQDVLLEHNQLLDEVFLGALLAKTFRNNTD